MNKTYRIIYNHHTGTYVAVAEYARARGKSNRAGKVLGTLAVGTSLALSSMSAYALVTVHAGSGDVNVSGLSIGADSCASGVQSAQTVYDAQGNAFTPQTIDYYDAWVQGDGGLAIGSGC